MGYNILLVADDRETKELLMLHLNSNGFTVDIAENEEMFNVCFGHQKANLILIDMMMKSLNIYELIRVIRLKSNLPIILIADKENDANRILGLNLGADACVIKPYNPLEVIAEVQAMLRRYYELGCGGQNTRRNDGIARRGTGVGYGGFCVEKKRQCAFSDISGIENPCETHAVLRNGFLQKHSCVNASMADIMKMMTGQ